MARIDPHASATHRTRRIDGLWGNRAFWTVALLACFALLSAAKPVVLHDGGAVTYFSLLFLWLASYFFGPRYGAACGIVFGIVRLGVTWVTGEYVNFAPGALVLEYPVACAVFALGCLIKPSPEEDVRSSLSEGHVGHARQLRMGYLVGVLAMGVCYVVSAVLFYPPDREGFLANLLFCITYDMSYLLAEAAITMAVLAIPQVVDAIVFLKTVATTKRSDPTLLHF